MQDQLYWITRQLLADQDADQPVAHILDYRQKQRLNIRKQRRQAYRKGKPNPYPRLIKHTEELENLD